MIDVLFQSKVMAYNLLLKRGLLSWKLFIIVTFGLSHEGQKMPNGFIQLSMELFYLYKITCLWLDCDIESSVLIFSLLFQVVYKSSFTQVHYNH